jgi:hypothetical protein
MKVIKGSAIVLFFLILNGSCFNPPEFPVEPSITFVKAQFLDNPDDSQADSLVIELQFRDGDGDLGLDANNPRDRESPFNAVDYLQSNSSGGQIKVKARQVEVVSKDNSTLYNLITAQNPNLGPLIVYDLARTNPLYSNLPAYQCNDYQTKDFIIAQADKKLMGRWSQIKKKLPGPTLGDTFLIVADTLYVKNNPNHYNIDIDFLVQTGPTTFEPFDFSPFCSTFYGRFPVLGDGETPVEGSLRYGMESAGWKFVFGQKHFKFRIKIRDRALNVSNEIVTEAYTLESIRVVK